MNETPLRAVQDKLYRSIVDRLRSRKVTFEEINGNKRAGISNRCLSSFSPMMLCFTLLYVVMA